MDTLVLMARNLASDLSAARDGERRGGSRGELRSDEGERGSPRSIFAWRGIAQRVTRPQVSVRRASLPDALHDPAGASAIPPAAPGRTCGGGRPPAAPRPPAATPPPRAADVASTMRPMLSPTLPSSETSSQCSRPRRLRTWAAAFPPIPSPRSGGRRTAAPDPRSGCSSTMTTWDQAGDLAGSASAPSARMETPGPRPSSARPIRRRGLVREIPERFGRCSVATRIAEGRAALVCSTISLTPGCGSSTVARRATRERRNRAKPWAGQSEGPQLCRECAIGMAAPRG